MKFRKTVILTLIILLATYIACQAVVVEQITGELHHNNITILRNRNGTFSKLAYIISSTGGSSGVHYRTSAITITVGGYTATIDTLELINKIKPAAGETVHSQITLDEEDIIKAIGEQHKDEIIILLKDSKNEVEIGANIQIYNSTTNEVYENIKNKNDVSSIAAKYSFDTKSVKDMESRFQGNTPGNIIIPKPTMTKGLRPSVLVQ